MEMSKCSKNCYICYIKLKTRVFRGLGSSNVVARETSEAQKLSREALSREIVAIQLR